MKPNKYTSFPLSHLEQLDILKVILDKLCSTIANFDKHIVYLIFSERRPIYLPMAYFM